MTDNVSRNERIKEASDYLRGTLADGLREEITGGIIEDDQQLVKFHGMYLQDDRDLRPERTRKKMEKAFSFMIRVRISGGVLSSAQWLALDHVARQMRRLRDESGPDSLAFLTSAKCTNEENYLVQKLARGIVGTNNVDHCARL